MGGVILTFQRALSLAALVFTLAFALMACGSGGNDPHTYTVRARAGTGGTISPARRSVSHGSLTTFTVTTDAGYSINGVTGCGGTLDGNTYTTGAITAACTVAASFTLHAPVAATLHWSPESVKRFHFTWSDVPVATEYRLMENPDGASGYSQVATIAPGVGSRDLEVSLPARLNASYVLSACNSVGCTDSAPVSVSGNLAAAVGYVKASTSGADDFFGMSVALSYDGNTLAVGAPFEDSAATGINGDQSDDSAMGSGAVYVFTRTGGVWSQQAYVKASNAGVADRFGFSIALSAVGDMLLVGAPLEESNATGVNGDQSNNDAGHSGAAYVFTRTGGVWSQQAYVKASNSEATDNFGYAVALSGDSYSLAVGARGEGSNATAINGDQSNNDAPNSGAVYVFTRSGDVWSQQAYVKASNASGGAAFGYSVAFSSDGDTLAVGAYNEGSSGAAYVFKRTHAGPSQSWGQMAFLKAANAEAGDQFGYAVALDGWGYTLAVGAPNEGGGATGIGGNQSDNSVPMAGAVYVFYRNADTWSPQAYVKATNTGYVFGDAVALSYDGGILAVGAGSESSNATGIGGDQSDNSAGASGAVYLFTRVGLDTGGFLWSPLRYVKAPNTGSGDYFGYSVALAEGDTTLAVGAYGEDSNANGVGGDQSDNSVSMSGAVYLY